MADYFIGITDKGKQRENNEDTFLTQQVCNKEFLIACVIDGVGGYNGGEVAAETARTVMLKQLQNLSTNIIDDLQLAVVAANSAIYQERKASEVNEQMACVLTCVIIHLKENKFYYAHVGDTRLYLLRDNSLVKISKDHSAIGFLEESGRLTEEDAMRHPRRNEINKALGFEEQISAIDNYIETGESPFLPADIILLCSDGLSDMISSATITSILLKNESLSEKARGLVNAANEAGGNDNITAVLVENKKSPVQLKAIRPVEKKIPVSSFKSAEKKITDKHTGAEKKSRNSIIVFLLILVAILSVALVIPIFQHTNKKNKAAVAIVIPKQTDRKLPDLISAAGDSTKIYKIPATDSVINISQPILINKDSFVIHGNGITINCDSNYKGPAFIISNTVKQIVLDSIVFKGFNGALVIQRNNVVFRNLRFINCQPAVQYDLSFPDSIIDGRLKDSIFFIRSKNK